MYRFRFVIRAGLVCCRMQSHMITALHHYCTHGNNKRLLEVLHNSGPFKIRGKVFKNRAKGSLLKAMTGQAYLPRMYVDANFVHASTRTPY